MKGYGIIYTILFCLFGCLVVSATQPTKPRMIVDNKPATIDHEAADIYRAMARLPLVQHGEVWTQEDNDSTLLVFPQPFKDTTWSLGYVQMRDYRDSTEIWLTSARITVGRVWPESCYVKNNDPTCKGWLKYIAVGERP